MLLKIGLLLMPRNVAAAFVKSFLGLQKKLVDPKCAMYESERFLLAGLLCWLLLLYFLLSGPRTLLVGTGSAGKSGSD